QTNVEIDRLAVEALGMALAGSSKPLVITSGTAMTAFFAPGQMATEDVAPPVSVPRVAAEEVALSMASRGVRASVVRLPPSVHGDGDQGFIPTLISVAREKGVSAYVGDGLNRWPAVHRLDAAHLFRLALERGDPGLRFHGVGDEGVRFLDIAGAIGRRLDLPLAAIAPEESASHFGFVGMIASLDCPASSAQTRERLGWVPTQVGLIGDLEKGHYFDS
ncbi:MAG TPA: 3-beta hydroxysteroid dehydrogenase, partial [Caulobacteraceae bacterium]